MVGSGGERVRRRITHRQIAGLAIAVMTVLFIVQNRDTVQIQLFTMTLTAPLWLLLVVVLGLGVLVGLLLSRRR